VTFSGTVLPFDLDLTIRATFTGPVQNAPICHFSYFNELTRKTMPSRVDKTMAFLVRTKPGIPPADVARDVDALFANADTPTRTESEKDFVLGFSSMLGNVTLFIYSLPTFWLALILLLVFGLYLGWFPIGGAGDPVLCPVVDSAYCVVDRIWHLALPALTLGVVGAAGTARFQRAAMLEVATQDYVRTARAKGLPERRVVLQHQLRNALLSFITRFGLAFPFLLTGAVLIETIFAWPGMGRLTTQAILQRDYPLVTAAALIASTLVVAGNLLADILLGVADPRLRIRGDALDLTA